jgi:hypothetical protein
MNYLVQKIVDSITRSSLQSIFQILGQFDPKCTIWVKNTNYIVKLFFFYYL